MTKDLITLLDEVIELENMDADSWAENITPVSNKLVKAAPQIKAELLRVERLEKVLKLAKQELEDWLSVARPPDDEPTQEIIIKIEQILKRNDNAPLSYDSS